MENLDTKDRIIRTSIGATLLLSMLIMPTSPAIVAALSLASFYPMLTALLAWDPLYHVVLSIAEPIRKTSSITTESKKAHF